MLWLNCKARGAILPIWLGWGTANHFSHQISYLVFPLDDLKFCRQLIVVYHFCGLKGFLKVSSLVPYLKKEKSVGGWARIRQSVEEWRSLLGGTGRVCAYVMLLCSWISIWRWVEWCKVVRMGQVCQLILW